jgi:hypothetical protein
VSTEEDLDEAVVHPVECEISRQKLSGQKSRFVWDHVARQITFRSQRKAKVGAKLVCYSIIASPMKCEPPAEPMKVSKISDDAHAHQQAA